MASTAQANWKKAKEYKNTTWVKLLRDDSSGRWSAGEIGALLENEYPEKYDATVLLDPGNSLEYQRIYYFYASDLEYYSGPGFGEFKPGHTPQGRTPDLELEAAIAHDAKAGLG